MGRFRDANVEPRAFRGETDQPVRFVFVCVVLCFLCCGVGSTPLCILCRIRWVKDDFDRGISRKYRLKQFRRSVGEVFLFYKGFISSDNSRVY